MTVTAQVRLTAKPGRREELLEAMAGSIATTRAQPEGVNLIWTVISKIMSFSRGQRLTMLGS